MTATHERPRALPTRYDGLLFRSKTEARHGVFFKTLGIVYDYEPQGFLTDGDPYLPDFLLPGQALIAEVKPSFDADPDGVRKWRNLVEARHLERGVLLLPIGPQDNRFLLIGPDGHGGLWEDDGAMWLCCPNGYHYDVMSYRQQGCRECPRSDGYWYEDTKIQRAFDIARSYKFGHGVSSG